MKEIVTNGSTPSATAPNSRAKTGPATGAAQGAALGDRDGKVVSLRTLLGPLWRAPEPPSYPAIEAVQGYWESLRGGRPAPARAELDPRPLADNLNVLFIAERIASGHARLRLCGQHFTDLLGMEPRGMPISVLFTAGAREDLANALEQVERGVRVTLPVRAEKGLGRPALEGMLALMPLADAQGRISRILGVLETHGQIGRAPRRFSLSGQARLKPPAPPVPAAAGRPSLRVIPGGKAG